MPSKSAWLALAKKGMPARTKDTKMTLISRICDLETPEETPRSTGKGRLLSRKPANHASS